MTIDVYPVGVLRALIQSSRLVRAGRRDLAYGFVRMELDTFMRRVRNRQWRALKCQFNGYLAEPCPIPRGLVRVGTGWTQNRARRSLARRISEIGDGS